MISYTNHVTPKLQFISNILEPKRGKKRLPDFNAASPKSWS